MTTEPTNEREFKVRVSKVRYFTAVTYVTAINEQNAREIVEEMDEDDLDDDVEWDCVDGDPVKVESVEEVVAE